MENRDTIEDIARTYQHKIYGLALSITRNPQDAQDIVQNAIMKIMAHLNDFRGESRISTWIYKIAYNETLLFLRKKNRFYHLFDTVDSYLRPSRLNPLYMNWSEYPDAHLIEEELKQRIEQLVMRLPIKYRMPLLLRRDGELSSQDIADILKVTPQTIKTRLHRVYVKIKKEIERYRKDKKPPSRLSCEGGCKRQLHFIYEYVHDGLNGEENRRFQTHISDCAPCQDFLTRYRKAIKITHAVCCYDIPSALQEKIDRFLAQAH
ncbi:MAG: sigma-70 family RNA polymerase sigma factor [Candidatus Omnitrophica bacterium]|nr:sigma-70 family RNA polymerase sigma factor [Candidatus Omnitrophota bacterium]